MSPNVRQNSILSEAAFPTKWMFSRCFRLQISSATQRRPLIDVDGVYIKKSECWVGENTYLMKGWKEYEKRGNYSVDPGLIWFLFICGIHTPIFFWTCDSYTFHKTQRRLAILGNFCGHVQRYNQLGSFIG